MRYSRGGARMGEAVKGEAAEAGEAGEVGEAGSLGTAATVQAVVRAPW